MIDQDNHTRVRLVMSYIEPLLWEDSDFMEIFCSGCEWTPKNTFDECPASNDPRCGACARSGLASSIEDSFAAVAREMEAWGCVG